MKNTFTFALAGNPNCGKTTLFNNLTGSTANVGNWPGVTVEKKVGRAKYLNDDIKIIDLPGIYSIVPYSPEEAIAGKYLKSDRPDLIINIVDASNIERNLYLTTQLMELDIPIVIALNMMDVVRKRGDLINCKLLSKSMGIKVVPISASKGEGLAELLKAADEEAKKPADRRHIPMPVGFIKDKDTALADARYKYIEKIVNASVKKHNLSVKSVTEKIDLIATNRVLAIPLFLIIIILIFYITFGPVGSFLVSSMEFYINSICSPHIDSILRFFGTSVWVRSLILDGVIAGVGSVLKFLPQILLLFLLLSFLEDSGYMARAAFIMDAPMRKIGLSGKSFVPLLMGFGCTVPAVMGTRILENEKDKRLTVLITPFMSCSAKTPIYALFIGAFFESHRTIAMLSIYLFGIVMGILSALLLKNSVLKGKSAPFVMELPDYRLPSIKTISIHVKRRIKDFLQKAGTTVFIATVLIWVLQHLSVDFQMTADSSKSLLSLFGKTIAPIFTLCGFGEWKPAVSLLAGLVAKESVLSSMGVLYGGNLKAALQMSFTPISACSFIIFVLFYTPCIASLSAIRREMGGVKWAAASALYQFATAWYCSAMFYQGATLIQHFI